MKIRWRNKINILSKLYALEKEFRCLQSIANFIIWSSLTFFHFFDVILIPLIFFLNILGCHFFKILFSSLRKFFEKKFEWKNVFFFKFFSFWLVKCECVCSVAVVAPGGRSLPKPDRRYHTPYHTEPDPASAINPTSAQPRRQLTPRPLLCSSRQLFCCNP